MADLPPRAISGTWTGRLIDVGGFEGELSMHLRARRGAVRGAATAEIGVGHTSERRRLVLRGEYSGDDVKLVGAIEKAEVEIVLSCRVFKLARGGWGMRGTYEVSARGFSPLRAGVVAASKDQVLGTVEVGAEAQEAKRETAMTGGGGR